jgi:hypothetical protein
MQGLIVDALTSKRIPAASRMTSLRRAVAQYASEATHANPNRHAAVAGDPTAKAAESRGIVSHVASSRASEVTRVYTGTMTMTGTASGSNGAHGTWSGTMSDSLTMILNGAGSGIGYESFSGDVTLTVKQSDGSTKSESTPLVFSTPVFNVRKGKFQYSQNSGLNFDGLYFTLNLTGGFSNGQAAVSEKLGLPFSEFSGDVAISGALKGASTLTTPPLSIIGAVANQLAGGKIMPFGNLVITDLNNATVTATVTLSNAHNGTLTNLAGGTYRPAKGIYTVTGSEAAVNSALEGLAFKPARLKSPASQVTTSFTVSVTDSQGASLSDSTTSVVAVNPVTVTGILKNLTTNGTRKLSLYHKINVHDFVPGASDDTVRVTLSDPKNGTLEATEGGVYNKKTGIFLASGSAATVTLALQGLAFVPASSPKSPVTTTVTLFARDSTGSFTGTTTITNNPPKAGTVGADVALFSQYVALGLHAIRDHAATLSPLHDQYVSAHFELASSRR